jgi:hypothetical protein
MKAGELRGTVRIRVDAVSHLYYQWRRHRPHPISEGPTFHIRPGGVLSLADGRELMRLPVGTWVRVEIGGTLGSQAAERFSLRVRVEGEETEREFTDLPTPGAFRVMDSLFIVAQGTEKAVFDVAGITLAPATQ